MRAAAHTQGILFFSLLVRVTNIVQGLFSSVYYTTPASFRKFSAPTSLPAWSEMSELGKPTRRTFPEQGAVGNSYACK